MKPQFFNPLPPKLENILRDAAINYKAPSNLSTLWNLRAFGVCTKIKVFYQSSKFLIKNATHKLLNVHTLYFVFSTISMYLLLVSILTIYPIFFFSLSCYLLFIILFFFFKTTYPHSKLFKNHTIEAEKPSLFFWVLQNIFHLQYYNALWYITMSTLATYTIITILIFNGHYKINIYDPLFQINFPLTSVIFKLADHTTTIIKTKLKFLVKSFKAQNYFKFCGSIFLFTTNVKWASNIEEWYRYNETPFWGCNQILDKQVKNQLNTIAAYPTSFRIKYSSIPDQIYSLEELKKLKDNEYETPLLKKYEKQFKGEILKFCDTLEKSITKTNQRLKLDGRDKKILEGLSARAGLFQFEPFPKGIMENNITNFELKKNYFKLYQFSQLVINRYYENLEDRISAELREYNYCKDIEVSRLLATKNEQISNSHPKPNNSQQISSFYSKTLKDYELSQLRINELNNRKTFLRSEAIHLRNQATNLDNLCHQHSLLLEDARCRKPYIEATIKSYTDFIHNQAVMSLD